MEVRPVARCGVRVRAVACGRVHAHRVAQRTVRVRAIAWHRTMLLRAIVVVRAIVQCTTVVRAIVSQGAAMSSSCCGTSRCSL